MTNRRPCIRGDPAAPTTAERPHAGQLLGATNPASTITNLAQPPDRLPLGKWWRGQLGFRGTARAGRCAWTSLHQGGRNCWSSPW